MCGTAHRYSPVLGLLPPGEYGQKYDIHAINKFMDMWSAIYTLWLVHCCKTIKKYLPHAYKPRKEIIMIQLTRTNNGVDIHSDSHWLTATSWVLQFLPVYVE